MGIILVLFQKPKCVFSYLFSGFLLWSFQQNALNFCTFPGYIFYRSSQSLRRKFSSPIPSQISHCWHPLLQLIHPSQSFSQLGRTGWSVSLCQSTLVPKQIRTFVGSLIAFNNLFLLIPSVCKQVCTQRSLTLNSLDNMPVPSMFFLLSGSEWKPSGASIIFFFCCSSSTRISSKGLPV